jgi:hypothetical protein
MDKAKFYACIRKKFFGKLTQEQVNSIEAILNECAGLDNRQVAYIFGTVYHETGHTMLPIEEYGKGKDYKYGKKIKRDGTTYSYPDKIYYGRGFVQLTWFENYQTFQRLLSIPLLEHPELALDRNIAAKILVTGMQNGLFTGKKLNDYFNDKMTYWEGARKIINGTDKAKLISGYAQKFYECIQNSNV